MGVLNKLSIIKLSIIKIINYQVVSYIHILLLTANKFRWGPGGELRIVLGWYNYAYIKQLYEVEKMIERFKKDLSAPSEKDLIPQLRGEFESFVRRTKSLKLGFGKDEKPDMGPLVSEPNRNRMKDLIKDALGKGANLETGGKIPVGMEEGYWFEPTVLTGVTPEMIMYREEIFGPLASVIKFTTDDQVLEMANDTEYGLASYIFTNNHKRIERFTRELEFGEVQVNGVKYSIYLPHGGIKNSGIGHDCSHLALDDYLVKKRITVKI